MQVYLALFMILFNITKFHVHDVGLKWQDVINIYVCFASLLPIFSITISFFASVNWKHYESWFDNSRAFLHSTGQHQNLNVSIFIFKSLWFSRNCPWIDRKYTRQYLSADTPSRQINKSYINSKIILIQVCAWKIWGGINMN